MYKEFKNTSNYQALQDNQINKIIAAQQRRYNPALLGDVYQEKPSNLYQQYLNETGLINSKNPKNTSPNFVKGNISGQNRSKSPSQPNYQDYSPPPKDPRFDEHAFDPQNIKNQPLPNMPRQDFYAGKPNPEPPKSVYSNHVNQPAPSRYGQPTHHMTEQLNYKLRSNNDDYSYVDTFEMDKKRANQNYSNLLGRKLGDPSTRPREEEEMETDIMGLPQKKGTLERQRMQKGARSKDDRQNRLFPALHYTEFKDNRPQRINPDPRQTQPHDVTSRTDRMLQALRNNQNNEE